MGDEDEVLDRLDEAGGRGLLEEDDEDEVLDRLDKAGSSELRDNAGRKDSMTA